MKKKSLNEAQTINNYRNEAFNVTNDSANEPG